jgi:probable HAF family extracellular repeat protein
MRRFKFRVAACALLCCAAGCGGSGSDAETARENTAITPARYIVVDLGERLKRNLNITMNNRQEILGEDLQGRPVLLQGETTVVLSDDSEVEAYSLNDRGQVVGRMEVPDHSWHAFFWQNGAFTDLGTLGGYNSVATGINNRGEIIGFSETDKPIDKRAVNRAFLYRSGEMITLDRRQGRIESLASTINDSGQILGVVWAAPSEYDGNPVSLNEVVWQPDGRMEVLISSPDFRTTSVRDINNAGVVSALLASRAVLLHTPGGGEPIDLTAQGGEPAFLAPGDINNRGQVLGNMVLDAIKPPDEILYNAGCYLFSEGKTYDLQKLVEADSGWELFSVGRINDNGYILAQGKRNGGPLRPLLLTPVFE